MSAFAPPSPMVDIARLHSTGAPINTAATQGLLDVNADVARQQNQYRPQQQHPQHPQHPQQQLHLQQQQQLQQQAQQQLHAQAHPHPHHHPQQSHHADLNGNGSNNGSGMVYENSATSGGTGAGAGASTDAVMSGITASSAGHTTTTASPTAAHNNANVAAATAAAAAVAPAPSPSALRGSLLRLAVTAERTERYDDLIRFMREIIKIVPSCTLDPTSAAAAAIPGARAISSLVWNPPPPLVPPPNSANPAAAQEASAAAAETAALLAAEAENARTVLEAPDVRDLTEREQQLLFVAVKNLIGQLRDSWKTMSKLQVQAGTPLPALNDPQADRSERYLNLMEDYKQQIEKEIHVQCSELLTLLEKNLLSVPVAKSRIFYCKMCGDLNRFLAEIVIARSGFNPAGCAGGYDTRSVDYYMTAHKEAFMVLPPQHPLRLQVALNYSVTLWEIMRERRKACEVARAAFDTAISKIDDLDPSLYKDATLVLQLMRDNLSFWTSPDAAHNRA